MRMSSTMERTLIEPISAIKCAKQIHNHSTIMVLWTTPIMENCVARSLVGVFRRFVGIERSITLHGGNLEQKRWTQLTHLFVVMTHQTHSCILLVVFAASCFDSNMSKRPGEIPDEPVSAKSKPIRGFCLMKRSDGSEAVERKIAKKVFQVKQPGRTLSLPVVCWLIRLERAATGKGQQKLCIYGNVVQNFVKFHQWNFNHSVTEEKTSRKSSRTCAQISEIHLSS